MSSSSTLMTMAFFFFFNVVCFLNHDFRFLKIILNNKIELFFF